MLNRELLEQQISELPLYIYAFIDPSSLEFTERIRYICHQECPMFGKTWACPPAVGSVEECKARCLQYPECLMISTITEVNDISDIEETLSTRSDHEALTTQVQEFMQQQGIDPFVLSTEACTICPRCAYLDGQPCRHPEKMHPCVESHGINIIPTLEEQGIEFQYGENVVTWVSLLFFHENNGKT